MPDIRSQHSGSSTGRPRTRRLSWKRKLFYAALSTLLFLGAIEGGVRLLGIHPKPRSETPLIFAGADFRGRFPLVWDDQLFWRMAKSAQIPDLEERLNPEGLRGPSMAGPKPRGTRRIVFLGDSNTFGSGVVWDATFAHRLSRWLAASTTARWEGLDAGVPGYTVFQMNRWLELEGLDFEPDVVIIYPGAWNDYTPGIGGDDESNAARIAASRSPFDGLRVVQVLKSLRAEDPGKLAAEEARRNAVISGYSARAERPDGPRVPREDFRRLLTKAGRSVRAQGGAVVLIVPPAPPETKRRFPEGEVYAGIVRDVAAAEGFGLVDIRSAFAAHPEPEQVRRFCPNDIIHPDVLGHLEIALALTLELKRQGVSGLPGDIPPERIFAPRLQDLHSKATLLQGDPLRPVPANLGMNPDVLALDTPHALRLDDVEIPINASLILNLGYQVTDSTPADADPAQPQVRVFVRASRPGDSAPTTLLDLGLGPNHRPFTRPRHRAVDLSAYSGQRITLHLEAQSTPTLLLWGPAAIEPFR